MSDSTRRTFDGARLTELPGGTAVLLVRSKKGKRRLDYEIRFARHVYADIRFLLVQQYTRKRRNGGV